LSERDIAADPPDVGPGGPLTLGERDFPELFDAADRASAGAQRAFVRSTAAQLLLLVLAAVAAAVSAQVGRTDVAAAIAALAFAAAASLKTHLLTTKPDKTWYQGRAAAESAKTLAWRYAVGGEPFRADAPDPVRLDRQFLERLGEILRPLDDIALIPSVERSDQITPWMRRLRGRSLEERRRAYREGRILDQQRWYATKAAYNDKRARQWGAVMLAFELAGVVLLLARAVGLLTLDLGGIAAAVAGTAAAWVQTKQHAALAAAYSVTARELGQVAVEVDDPTTEDEWAKFVGHAEDAVSREHTLWLASRGKKADE